MSASDAPPARPAPPSPTAGGRLDFVDAARGLAVLFMIQWHCVHAWSAPAARDSVGFEIAQLFGGFAAPGFLLLAGAGMALRWAGDARRGTAATQTALSLARRGAVILVLGYLLRLQFALATSNWRNLLRFDVLQVIGVAMVIGAAVALALGALPRHPVRVLIAGLALFVATPYVARALPADWPSWLTAPLARRVAEPVRGTYALFPIFPYVGHLLVGLAVGAAWDRAGRGLSVRLAVVWTTLVGLVVCAVMFDRSPLYHELATLLPGPDGGAALRYGSRDGVVLLSAGLGFLLLVVARPAARVLVDLGRASMPVYWIHLSVAYLTPGQKLGPLATVLCTVALVAAMWVVARIRLGPYERLVRRIGERRRPETSSR